jgi:hypothetical protein
MSKKLIRESVAVAGLAAVALAGAMGIAGAATQSDAGPTLPSMADGRPAQAASHAPFATRAESLRLARRLLAKVALPPGTHRFRGGKLPAALSGPAEKPSSDHLVDVHRVFAERRSMRRTIAFLNHHRPAGWSSEGTGEAYTIDHGKKIITEEDVSYAPKHTAPAFNEIQLLVEVVPGHHGHALTRVDAQVIWYPRRSAAEYLIAKHFRAVRIDEWVYGTHARHVKRTFRQRAIIDKLARVLNSLPASSGGVWSCPLITRTYQLTFKPVKGKPGAVVQADGCAAYGISIAGHAQPALAESGKIEEIARNLLRGSHQPKR